MGKREILIAVVALVCQACGTETANSERGTDKDRDRDSDTASGQTEPSGVLKPGSTSDEPGVGADGGTSETTPVDPDMVEPPPQLLPFEPRLARVANAIGVSPDHSMFNRLRTKHALGVLPDTEWKGLNIASWIDGLRPVCDSTEMLSAYPALPAELPALIQNAWGRAPSPEDLAAFTAPTAVSLISAPRKYQTLCLGVFTALECVYR